MEEVPLVAAILAHHPGWEGFALVIIPIVVIAAALAVVKRRVEALPVHDASGPDGHGGPSGDITGDVVDDITSR